MDWVGEERRVQLFDVSRLCQEAVLRLERSRQSLAPCPPVIRRWYEEASDLEKLGVVDLLRSFTVFSESFGDGGRLLCEGGRNLGVFMGMLSPPALFAEPFDKDSLPFEALALDLQRIGELLREIYEGLPLFFPPEEIGESVCFALSDLSVPWAKAAFCFRKAREQSDLFFSSYRSCCASDRLWALFSASSVLQKFSRVSS